MGSGLPGCRVSDLEVVFGAHGSCKGSLRGSVRV